MRMTARLKAPAYARDVLAMKQSGQRIGLLVVSVHDWDAGKDLADKPGVARIVIPQDLPPEGADLSLLTALDVLLVGEDSPAFWMAVRGAFAWRAATVWIDDKDDVLRLTDYPTLTTMQRAPRSRLAHALTAHRDGMLLSREWPYDQPVFEPARQSLMRRLFGSMEAPCSP